MCGIVFAKKLSGSPVSKSLLKRFEKQRGRGTEGFGYVAVENNTIVDVVRTTDEDVILAKLEKETASEILFHHRMPTSTPNYAGASHPILVSDPRFTYDYLVVHNGIITNHADLKKKHEGLGIMYTTEYSKETRVDKTEYTTLAFADGFVEMDNLKEQTTEKKITTGYNDSESLAIELALFCEGWEETVDTRGSVATIFYQINKDAESIIGSTINTMFYVIDSMRPLVLEKQGKKGNSNDLIVLKSQGDGVDIQNNLLFSVRYDENGAHVEHRKIHIGYKHAYGFGYGSHYSSYKDVDDKNKGLVTSTSHTPLLDSGEGEDDYDAMLKKQEEDLEEILNAEIIKEWDEKATDAIQGMRDVKREIDDLKERLKTEPRRKDIIEQEIKEWANTYALYEDELLDAQDNLIEMGAPVPPTVGLPTIKY